MVNDPVIVALDYSCLKYLMYFRGHKGWDPQIHGFKPGVLDYWFGNLQGTIRNILTGVLDHVGQDADLRVVGLLDQPWPEGYWRSRVYKAQQDQRVLEGLEPLHFKIKKQESPDYSYKGNRLAKTSYSDFLRLCHELLWRLPYPVLKHPGLEADDHWGLLAQYHGGLRCYGVTLDQDWALCASNTVFWVNLHRTNYLRVYDQSAALEIFQKTYKGVNSLSCVPWAKSLKGERSDNLGKGFDPRLADLVKYSAPSPQVFGSLNFEPWDFEPAHLNAQAFVKSLDFKEIRDPDHLNPHRFTV